LPCSKNETTLSFHSPSTRRLIKERKGKAVALVVDYSFLVQKAAVARMMIMTRGRENRESTRNSRKRRSKGGVGKEKESGSGTTKERSRHEKKSRREKST
jgi:hypothetical protein